MLALAEASCSTLTPLWRRGEKGGGCRLRGEGGGVDGGLSGGGKCDGKCGGRLGGGEDGSGNGLG